MILLSVLGAIGIIYIMIVQMASDAVFTSQYYERIIFREKSYYMARSAFSGVMQIFHLDNPDFDSLADEWAREFPPFHMEEENVYLSIKIEDMERYFNPNSIVENDKIKDRNYQQFRRLLEVLFIDPNLSNAVVDWIDTDHQRTMPLGADGLDYRDIPAKGGSLDSIEELNLIQGFTPEMLRGQDLHDREVTGLRDLLSVYTNGMVNVNTAPREVLLSLDDEMSEDVVNEIIRIREDVPFQSMDDLLNLSGINHDLLFRMKQLSSVKSEHFRITISVENYQKEASQLVVIIKRSGQTGKIVFWQAD